MKRDRPVMIYDGDCHFCTRWIERWKTMTGERVEYRKSQGLDLPPGVAREDCDRSVQFIDEEWRRCDRAEAVFSALARAGRSGRFLLLAYQRVPGFGALADGAYDVVASHRMLFSRLTRLLWGNDVRPPSYGVASWLFLRLLGMIYLIAFVSFGVQAAGLVGENGILPVGDVVDVVKSRPDLSWIQFPSLVLVGDPYAMLTALAWIGGLCAVLVCIDMAAPLALGVAWVCHLSLVVAGQEFYGFQWDALLLETGWLAVFLAGWSWKPGLRLRQPSRWAHFLLLWLLFRLMFSSGVVKLASGDPTWANLTALDYHYWTQPIPNPISWFMAQMPVWWQKFSCAVMFGIELVLPFCIFLPRRPRLFACAGFIGLSLLIELTGNYGYFNLLSVCLAALLIDDAVWPRSLCRAARESRRIRWTNWILPPLALGYLLLSVIPLFHAFRTLPRALEPLALWHGRYVQPFRLVNSYGLFAVMTTSRPEILIQGSMDGVNWKTYRFKYKPGPLDRPPPFVAPYMPRLDWQMWFAALGDVRQSPWMAPFFAQLFEAEPDVLNLMESDPFQGRKPHYLRALLDNYQPAGFGESDWWLSEPRATYVSQMSSDDL